MNRLVFIPLILLLIVFSILSCAVPQTNPISQSPAVPKSQPGTALAPQAAQLPAAQDFVLKIDEPDDESVVKVNTISLSGTVTPDADVTINGVSVSVDKGSFIAMIEMEEGPNSIEVIASDGKGHKISQLLTVIYFP